MKRLFVASALVGAATTGFAQAAADPRDQAPNSTERESAGKADEKGERLVCRWVTDADVGSLVRGRTRRCLTAEQWRALNLR